jgi:hypothetical protein
MLRVYCSWPGVSAMMNLRAGVGEVAVGDVDGDALLALGDQAVGQQRQVDLRRGRACAEAASMAVERDRRAATLLSYEQTADERALAVVDAAGSREAQHDRCAVRWGRLEPVPSSEIPLALAQFHRGLVGLVVQSGGAALGNARRRGLGDDVVERPRRSMPRAPVQVMSPTVRKRTTAPLDRLARPRRRQRRSPARSAPPRRTTSRSCAK